jgi:hypothetical protein
MGSEHCAPGRRGDERYLLLGYPAEAALLYGDQEHAHYSCSVGLEKGSAGQLVTNSDPRASLADKAATDHHILRNNVTLKLCILSEYKRDTVHVALDLAIEMKLALRFHVASDR